MTIQKVCTDSLGNIGSLACTKNNPFVDAVSLLITTSDFEFTAKTNFATEADYKTAIKAKSVYPLHGIVEFDDQSEDFQYYESPSGVRIPRRAGKNRYVFMFNKSLEVHKALQSFRNGNFKVFIIDDAGNVSGTSPDGVKVTGLTVEMFNPEKMKRALQDNTPAWTPVVVDLADNKEWDEDGIFFKPAWNPLLLEAVSDVEVSVVSASATEIIVKVAYYNGIDADGNDVLVGAAGIDEADFVFTTTAPTAGYTDNGDGTYTFTGAAMVSGSVDLKAPSAQASTGSPIESTGAAVITIL